MPTVEWRSAALTSGRLARFSLASCHCFFTASWEDRGSLDLSDSTSAGVARVSRQTSGRRADYQSTLDLLCSPSLLGAKSVSFGFSCGILVFGGALLFALIYRGDTDR